MMTIVLREHDGDGLAVRDMCEPAVPHGWAKARMRAALLGRVDLPGRGSGGGIATRGHESWISSRAAHGAQRRLPVQRPSRHPLA